MDIKKIFMQLALWLSKRSKCKRKQVGCVITDKEFTKVLAIGYNGGPRKQKDTCTGIKPCGCVHAETNALVKCEQDFEKVIFVTDFPCQLCATLIVNSRASEVFYFRQTNQMHPAMEILKRGGIKCTRL